ncbi:hypothetical protein V9T40_012458 [Parthenolecanium corni]|uniref:Multivesicular body subunit 12A n=1 Tax=Parthenolecanium corni TaxID=536013 RepID=A0AAN9T789_9HEMI
MSKAGSKGFSDDKPITAVIVIEDLTKCPKGFTVISRTYDTDFDADLWKENSFFARKVTRYLCISRLESIVDYVLENLVVINDKELPPEGYGSIPKTSDTDQKAWRKKQLCYKLSRKNICHSVVTDIILLGRNKRAPDGYSYVGDLNGLILCLKSKPAATVFSNISPSVNIFNGLMKSHTESSLNGNSAAPTGEISFSHDNEPHDYEKLVVKPTRPAPAVPSQNQFNCSSSYQGIQGIPFLLNTRLEASSRSLLASLPSVQIKTKEDIEKEYSYDFKTEKQLCMY